MTEISKTTDQALAVLEELADNGPLTATEVSRRLDLNRTVVYRLLSTLHHRGFIIRAERGYLPGPILVRIAEAVQPALRGAARNAMAALRDEIDETVVLYIPDGDEHVVIHQASATNQVLRAEHSIGSRTPLYAGCPAFAMLAYSSEALVERMAQKSGDPQKVYERIEAVRTDGYALTHDEVVAGLHGMAVPVLVKTDRAVAALAVILPSSRASTILGHLDSLTKAAQRVSETLQADPTVSRVGSG